MFTPKRMYDCCVCGHGFKLTDLHELDMKRVDKKLVRHLNTTLCEQKLCRNCRRKCPGCYSLIPAIQQKTHERCFVCMGGDSLVKKQRKKL